MSDKQKELLHLQLSSLEECQYPDRKKGLLFIHDFDFNGNGLKIPEELASENIDSLNGTPLVAYYNSKIDDIEDHKEVRDKKTNKIIALNTDAVGTLFNAHIGTHEINEDESKYGVWADCYIWKRFNNTLGAVERLYEENGHVDVSVEVAFTAVEYCTEGKIAQESLNYFGTALLGSKYNGAYSDAGLYALNNLEVASAYEQDLNQVKSDLDINLEKSRGENMFKFLLETNATTDISFAEMRKIMNSHLKKISKTMMLKKQMTDLNAMDAETYGEMATVMLSMMSDDSGYFDFWIPEDGMFEGYCVCSDWYNGIMKMDWVASGNEVTISNPRKARIAYVDDDASSETVVNSILKDASEIIKKNEELNSQIETKTQELEAKVTEFNTLVEEKAQLESKITELSSVKTEAEQKDEAIISLNNQINELTGKIGELAPIKEAWDAEQEVKRIAELNSQKEELKNVALNSEMIKVEELESNEEIKQAIEELNTQKINDIIVKRIIESKVKKDIEPELNSKKDVTLTIDVNGKDLIPETLEQKFGLNL